jgi:phosphoglucosamine mutase
MRKIFGTDGIRGIANQGNLTAEKILRLAQATGLQFQRGNHRHLVIIGKDTRLSGYMLEPALTAGFISIGMDVVLVGPMPTPAIAILTSSLRADLGVMISASHNPHHDNGIKFFGPDGQKLPDAIELKIEKGLETLSDANLAAPEHLGKAKRLDDALGRYVEYVKATFPKGLRLSGLKVVIDCANGAAYKIAPTVLWELGAEIISIGVKPDGFNINEGCGATATETMRAAVLEHKADIGIALDGDADRVMICDESGTAIDGDQILALIAASWHQKGILKGNTVVGTIMANLGLEKYLAEHGIGLVRSQVGDRYVAQAMREHGSNIGGEPSGHVVLSDYTTTGDGLITALQVLAVLTESKKPASKICSVFKPVQQVHENIKLPSTALLEKDAFKALVSKAQAEIEVIGGRLIVRKSGTEPLLRIMGECEQVKEMESILKALVDAIKKLGTH